jgi:16S rRNA (guanine(966)-N(2))-methyltransferase RsmD
MVSIVGRMKSHEKPARQTGPVMSQWCPPSAHKEIDMRIIAGFHRSRKLLAPEDDKTTRPITDRAKQALFDKIWALGAMEGVVLDVFAGTGSMGLEALSRGCEYCTFIERDRTARKLLDQNIKALKYENQTNVLGVDALSPTWLGLIKQGPIDLVFMDPPYPMTQDPDDLARLLKIVQEIRNRVSPGGVLMLRTSDKVEPPKLEGWSDHIPHDVGRMVMNLYIK